MMCKFKEKCARHFKTICMVENGLVLGSFAQEKLLHVACEVRNFGCSSVLHMLFCNLCKMKIVSNESVPNCLL